MSNHLEIDLTKIQAQTKKLFSDEVQAEFVELMTETEQLIWQLQQLSRQSLNQNSEAAQ
ncbi:MAG: hypothetical protein HC919_10780 [Oscillatoriales cyanobacterium SM2_2_1]|nr:hypothetical protein [Oscillatoriales cyanobacterium SM2_2_1]